MHSNVHTLPTRAAASFPTPADLNVITGTVASISGRWGVTQEPGELGASVLVGRESGGCTRWDAKDAYSLSRNPMTGMIDLVDLADPADILGSFTTTAIAASAMRDHSARR